MSAQPTDIKAELEDLRANGDPRVGPAMRAAVLDLLTDDQWGDWVDAFVEDDFDDTAPE